MATGDRRRRSDCAARDGSRAWARAVRVDSTASPASWTYSGGSTRESGSIRRHSASRARRDALGPLTTAQTTRTEPATTVARHASLERPIRSSLAREASRPAQSAAGGSSKPSSRRARVGLSHVARTRCPDPPSRALVPSPCRSSTARSSPAPVRRAESSAVAHRARSLHQRPPLVRLQARRPAAVRDQEEGPTADPVPEMPRAAQDQGHARSMQVRRARRGHCARGPSEGAK